MPATLEAVLKEDYGRGILRAGFQSDQVTDNSSPHSEVKTIAPSLDGRGVAESCQFLARRCSAYALENLKDRRRLENHGRD